MLVSINIEVVLVPAEIGLPAFPPHEAVMTAPAFQPPTIVTAIGPSAWLDPAVNLNARSGPGLGRPPNAPMKFVEVLVSPVYVLFEKISCAVAQLVPPSAKAVPDVASAQTAAIATSVFIKHSPSHREYGIHTLATFV